MPPTFNDRVASQQEAEQSAAAFARATRDAEIAAWHRSFGSTPHDQVAQAAASPAAAAASNPAIPAGSEKLSATERITLGMKMEREAKQAREAPAPLTLPDNWRELPASEKIRLGLAQEGMPRHDGQQTASR